MTSNIAREALEAAREALRADNMFTLSVKIDAALAALDAETEGWRTMDSAPKDGTNILLRVPDRGGFFYAVEGAFVDGDWHAAYQNAVTPTHWARKPRPIVPPESRS